VPTTSESVPRVVASESFSTASGSELGFRKGLIDGASLATARGTESGAQVEHFSCEWSRRQRCVIIRRARKREERGKAPSALIPAQRDAGRNPARELGIGNQHAAWRLTQKRENLRVVVVEVEMRRKIWLTLAVRALRQAHADFTYATRDRMRPHAVKFRQP